jgi:hypothetical protein
MFKQILSAALVIACLGMVSFAQTPSLPLVDNDAPTATPALPSDVGGVDVDAMIVHEGAMGDCGCPACAGSACGTPHMRMTWKQRCAYYMSVRNAFDRGPCCAEELGGFGPLWETYCMDKQNCCAQSCGSGCAHHCRTAIWPRRRGACQSCDTCAGACDPTMPAHAPMDIGQPPQPADAGPDPQSTPDAVEEAPVDPPVENNSQAKSKRRGWLSRSISWGPAR